MLLIELFDQLRHGELSQHTIGGKNAGEIRVERYPEMVTHFNAALRKLHGRFLLREDETVIQQYAAITRYQLEPQFAVNSGSAEVTKYIVDTVASPFLDNVLKVERAYDEVGDEIPINDATKTDSIYTPKYNVVQIPAPVATNATTLIYRGNHPKISVSGLDPATEEIDIAEVLVDALLNFVAHRVMAPLGQNDRGHPSQEFLAKYEADCQHVLNHKLLNADNTPSTKSELLGWV